MKTAQIQLGGELRTLDFTRAGLYDHIQDASCMPAFDFLKSITPKEGEQTTIIETAKMTVLIYAGLNSAHDVAGKPCIDFETVKRWVRSVEITELETVYNAVLTAMAGDQGEVKSQPEQGSN